MTEMNNKLVNVTYLWPLRLGDGSRRRLGYLTLVATVEDQVVGYVSLGDHRLRDLPMIGTPPPGGLEALPWWKLHESWSSP